MWLGPQSCRLVAGVGHHSPHVKFCGRASVLLVAAALASCGGQDPSRVATGHTADQGECPDRPRPVAVDPGSGHGDYFPPYRSLDDLTGASELVVLGTVIDTARGPVSGAQTPVFGGFQVMIVTLDVMETYRGDQDAEVLFYESGWKVGPPDEIDAENGVHRSRVGDCGFYFLTRGEPQPGDPPEFRLTSIQGKFIAEGESGVFAGYERSDPLSDELAAMSFSEFRDAVQASAERMRGVPPREVECRQAGPIPHYCAGPEDRPTSDEAS